jgi:hypothetical protein
MLRASALALALACAPGCLVVSLHPAYDDGTIAWDPSLTGSWVAADDKVTLDVEPGEWRSYRMTYVHPIESAVVTGYLTGIGDDRYLDVMPARGEDRGSFLVPVHAVLRIRVEEDRLELTPLSYDWFDDRRRAGRPIAGLEVETDQKDNALIVSQTGRLRVWLRAQPSAGPMFGAPAVFTRVKAAAAGRQ